MSKERMNIAKAMIDNGQYDAAKAVLQTINHPTARAWEVKLDRLSTRKAKNVESVLYQSAPSMHRQQPALFIIIVLSCALGVGLFILPLWWLSTRSTMLTVTSERISLRRGLLSKRINEIYLADVRNVKISQSLFQRMMSTGVIEISTASSSDDDIRVSGLPDPYKIKAIIDSHRRNS